MCLFALVAVGLAKEETKRDKRHGFGYGGFGGIAGYGATAYAAPVATIAAAPVAAIATAPVIAQTVGINHHTHTHSVEKACSNYKTLEQHCCFGKRNFNENMLHFRSVYQFHTQLIAL